MTQAAIPTFLSYFGSVCLPWARFGVEIPGGDRQTTELLLLPSLACQGTPHTSPGFAGGEFNRTATVDKSACLDDSLVVPS